MKLLEGKVALVSGGASGMGASHARAIVAHGGKVVIGDISDAAGAALADELGDSAACIHLDVTRNADWLAAVDFAVARFGGLNVLVNNAGILRGGALGEFTEAQFREIIDVNLTGTFLGISAAAGMLKACAPSSIINVSSIAGMQGGAGLHGYCASKWAIRGLTRSAALELGPAGVRVNTVIPGAVRTPMTADLPDSIQDNSFGRFGAPDEVANLIVYLASDLSSFSNGADFVVDGGQVAGPQLHEQAGVWTTRSADRASTASRQLNGA